MRLETSPPVRFHHPASSQLQNRAGVLPQLGSARRRQHSRWRLQRCLGPTAKGPSARLSGRLPAAIERPPNFPVFPATFPVPRPNLPCFQSVRQTVIGTGKARGQGSFPATTAWRLQKSLNFSLLTGNLRLRPVHIGLAPLPTTRCREYRREAVNPERPILRQFLDLRVG